jgi:hypothetical protein
LAQAGVLLFGTMMNRILVLCAFFPALQAANDEFNRDTQSPMVWLHLRGRQHPKFLQESGSNSVIDVYVEQGPSVGHFNGLQVPKSNLMKEAYESFTKVFPRQEFAEFSDILKKALNEYETSSAFTAYSTIKGQPRCGEPRLFNATKEAIKQRHVTPYPGGASLPLLGMDLVGKTLSQLERANGPASAQVPGVALLTQNALKQVKGVIQSVVAATMTDIPPTIPPPVWNNQPFPCMPMVTGSNCFGAVLYPITIGDFVMADMTDNALNGVVASFPAYYRRHVGSTDDRTYQRCFKSYMSMQCANSFPVCTTVQARQAEVPFLGRGPMCFLHCIQTLVSCPGLWVEDLEDICRHVSVPPVCSFANYRKDGPPQLTSFDESEGLPLTCP